MASKIPRSDSTERLTIAGDCSNIPTMSGALLEADVALVDSLVVPASLHDADGRYVRLNTAGERASGHSNAEMLGRHFTEMLPPGAREYVLAHFRRAVEHGEPADFETPFVDATGSLRCCRAQHLPLRRDGTIVGVLILAFAAPVPPRQGNLESRPHLTPRQKEILGLVAAGLSTTEIAEMLSLSTETVRNHLRNLRAELGARTRIEAVATARRRGLLSPAALEAQPAPAGDGRAPRRQA